MAKMNPAQKAMMPTMGIAATPIASICRTAESQRFGFPISGNVLPNAWIVLPDWITRSPTYSR